MTHTTEPFYYDQKCLVCFYQIVHKTHQENILSDSGRLNLWSCLEEKKNEMLRDDAESRSPKQANITAATNKKRESP